MSDNYRIQIGGLKAAAIYHEPKTEGGRGLYTIGITKSEKQSDGTWKDQTVYVFPSELFVLSDIIGQMKKLFLKPQKFEIKKQDSQQENKEFLDSIDDSTIPF